MIRMLCLLLIAACLSMPLPCRAGVTSPARVHLVEGEASFRTPDDGEWRPASINTPLDEGDAIWCADGSRVEIQLPDGSLVRLDGGSQLDVLANEEEFVHLHLAGGNMYLRSSQGQKDRLLQIDADDTTILPAGRTRLRIDMLPNSQEDVSIFKGSAYVEGNGNHTRVRAGEHIAVEEGHSELLGLNPPDDWEQWNVNRDRALSKAARTESYLPDELKNYSDELGASGYWVRVPEFGMVWRPMVILNDDWAPYRNGRWIWRGGDYIWVSYDNWGWAPYHYGRWAVVDGQGWCWVPPGRGDVNWGPGFVGWYRTGDHIGWTPLAPGETYYGHGSYGRHSVNINTTTISNSTVVYQNRRAPGGVTTVHQNDFIRGKNAIQQIPRGALPAPSVAVGSPRIMPQREARMPEIKTASTRSAAPPRVEHRDTRELRQRFPRVFPVTSPQIRGTVAPVTTQVTSPAQPSPNREKRVIHPVPEPTVRSEAYEKPTPQTVLPQRVEYPQRTASQPVVSAPQAVPPQRGEHPRKDVSRPQVKQKRVWKVTTPEHRKEEK